MSKSRGNFITLRDALERWSPDALRLYLLSHHYRRTFDFEVDNIKEFEDRAACIRRTVDSLKRVSETGGEGDTVVKGRFKRHIDRFFRAMGDDLDTPNAIDALTTLIGEVEAVGVKRVDADLLKTVLKMLSIVGLE
jgi:cysteinyl-tRNA synthetase